MLKPIHTPLACMALLLIACAIPPSPTTGPKSPAELRQVDSDNQVATAGQALQTPAPLATEQPLAGVDFASFHEDSAKGLWGALRQGFALPEQNNTRVTTHRDWYIKHPEYLSRVSERARRYAWHIHQEIARRDMPAEIALLPVVESAFDPFAYSHGRAAGLWQFIPATGKRFGLKQDWWYDGRRDVVDSTRAALDYLEYLHRRFDGDWLLALAAYNSGEGTVLKAQRRNRKKGKQTDFWALDLPRETRDYVPKLVALKQLVESPEQYGIELEPIEDEPYFAIIDMAAQIDLAVAADLAGIQLDSLYRLNPGFNQWATPPEGPHRLLVPAGQADTIRRAIAELPAEHRMKWIRHKVRGGETLSHIARRYHTTVAAVKSANDLDNNAIRAGKYLIVPVSSQNPDSYRLSARQRLARQQTKSRRGNRVEHTVATGDTFWDLARHYNVGVRKLAAWNGMAPGDTLRVGQKLVVWVNQPSPRSAHPGTKARAVHYTVRKGDSLSRISNRFKVTVADLRRWNDLGKGRYLQPGQRLKLFVDVTRQAAGT